MGIRAARGKRLSALVLAICLALAVVAIPAYAIYYVHGENNVANDSAKGVIEVTVTLDESAADGSVRAGLVFVHEGDTAQAVLEEALESSESQNGLEAIHDYGYESLGDYLADKTYTITVYDPEDQQPGTHTTHDGSGQEGADVALTRYCNVVITVTK